MRATAARWLRMTTALWLILLTAAPAAPQSKPQSQTQPPAADEDEVIRVETRLVTVPVAVRDKDGRFIPGLRPEQFHLFEDGAEQEIAFFETADKPFTVALVLDLSDSARFKREDIRAAARAFTKELRADDRLAVVAFDKNVAVLTGPTSDRALIDGALGRLKSGGGTSLYDALAKTFREPLGRARGRKAVVLFTDGVDTTSRATYESTLADAAEADALVYSIQYETIDYASTVQLDGMASGQGVRDVVTSKGEPLSVAYKRAGLYLRLLADKTGGRAYRADTVENLSRSFARIAAELREQYSIGYYPKAREGRERVRRIKVKVDAPGARVRSRERFVFDSERGARGDCGIRIADCGHRESGSLRSGGEARP